MAEPKTKPSGASVVAHIDALADPRRRAECRTLLALMARASGEAPAMWGSSIVGFGRYRYRYASGTTGEWPLTAFASRAKDLTVYLMDGFDQRSAQLARLGPHTRSRSCLYLKSLDAIDVRVLESMVADSVAAMRARWPADGATDTVSAAAAAAKRAAGSSVKTSSTARGKARGAAPSATKARAKPAAKPATRAARAPARAAATPPARRGKAVAPKPAPRSASSSAATSAAPSPRRRKPAAGTRAARR